MGAAHDQKEILNFLHRRALSSGPRYCTIRTLIKESEVADNDQYVRAIVEDLEISGFVNTRQIYSAEGKRLFQISAQGIDLVESGGSLNDGPNSRWTGQFNVSEAQRSKLIVVLVNTKSQIDVSHLTNSQKANAHALIDAAKSLSEAPDPPWSLVLRILSSPVLANVAALVAIAVALIKSS